MTGHHTFFVLILGISISVMRAFMFDDKCRMTPWNIPGNKTETMDVEVPLKCSNGTFDWNYPQGHFRVHFPNPTGASFSVCFKDSLNGAVFHLVDVTGRTENEIGHVEPDSDLYICTSGHIEKEIVVRMDAPDIMYYMGEVAFKIGS